MRVFLYIRKSWQVNVLHVFPPLLCFCTHTQALGKLPTPPSTVAVLSHNKAHNRFKNIYPCELLGVCDKYTKAYWDNTALEPLIMDTLNTFIPCLYTFPPLNNGQNACPQFVHYSEAPLNTHFQLIHSLAILSPIIH